MNIVISGASSGIGRATVLALAKMGTHAIFGISRSEEKLLKLQTEVKLLNNGSSFGFLNFDLEKSDYKVLINSISKFFNTDEGIHIDILINNAGYLVNKTLVDTTDEDWEKSQRINVQSALKLSLGLMTYFAPDELTHIVNIGSMGGVQGTQKFSGLGAYSASKAALNSLTESMAAEWKMLNIHANCINPGSVQTEMLAKAFPGYKALISDVDMGKFVANFAINSGKLMNGRILQISLKS